MFQFGKMLNYLRQHCQGLYTQDRVMASCSALRRSKMLKSSDKKDPVMAWAQRIRVRVDSTIRHLLVESPQCVTVPVFSSRGAV
jgi:hypothetical protein